MNETTIETMPPTASTEANFEAIWDTEAMYPDHPAMEAAVAAIDRQFVDPEAAGTQVDITDVTLRDGQQQQTNEVTTEQRIEVFDNLVQTGVKRIEIGHLGNKKGDRQLSVALVEHVAAMEKVDERYKDLELQVLFGSQEEQIAEGSQLLRNAFMAAYPDDWEAAIAERVVVHVYDRVDPNLLNTASAPYTIQDAAYRVSRAADYALEAGFKKFSVSGEATTAITPEESIQYYRSVTHYLLESDAEEVDINLPNTYGYSTTAEWNAATIAGFNAAVKYGFAGKVTASIHPHNDVDNAVSFTMNAVVGGIDRIQGTHIGVGERTGNVATIDVVARFLEQARHQILREKQPTDRFDMLTRHAGDLLMSRTVQLSPDIIDNLHNWYSVGQHLSDIFGPHADYRWRRTAVGNLYAHDNGSGPHDQAMAAAITNPVATPGDSNYEWALLTHNILGRPGTEAIALGDPQAVDDITVGNHAGGGKTEAIKAGTVHRATPEVIEQAQAEFSMRKREILNALRKGIEVVAG